jgi:nitrogen fixation protein FixH
MSAEKREFRLTGYHVLAGLIVFFGVVFAANFVLVYLSGASWTGKLPGNGYEASIKYNKEAAKARAMLAKGWKTRVLVHADGRVEIELKDRDGRPLTGLSATATVGRPASDREDRSFTLVERDIGVYALPEKLRSGAWRIEARFYRRGELQWRADARFVIARDAETSG